MRTMGWWATRRRAVPAAAALAAGSLAAGVLAPLPAHSAGFALIEQNASGLGNAFAGSAANAQDASVMFFNPAALTALESPELTFAAHAIDLQADFSDRGSVLPPAGLGALPTGATRADAGDVLPVPNFYAALPWRERFAFGLGVSAPFGLKTEYPDPWIGRFQGIKSELVTVSVNPTFAWRVNEVLSLGIGATWQHARAELTNAVLLGPATEGRARVDASDDAWGYTAGALLTVPATRTRLGLGYRSRVNYRLTGDTDVTTLGGVPIAAASGATRVALRTPDMAYLSLAQPLGDRVELYADASWTRWSDVYEVAAVDPATGTPRDLLRFDFRDTWRGALGASFRLDERWLLRAGLAYDESPVTTEHRTVRLPDADRWWASIGARWAPSERWALDAGYARLFLDSPDVALTRPQLGAPAAFASTVAGEYDSSVNILSAQVTYRFR